MSERRTEISRRSFLGSLGATGGLRCLAGPLVPVSLGSDFLNLGFRPVRADGKTLATPDFARLAATMRASGGLRPHRDGGVRLGRDLAFEQATPGKYLIHNYGHGGAGITLSWGCAAKVRDEVAAIVRRWPSRRPAPKVAILGAGVIGLTVADELRRLSPRLSITVYRKEASVEHTTSFIAGGQFEPSGIWREYTRPDGPSLNVLAEYLTLSLKKIKALQALPNNGRLRYGVARRYNYTLDEENGAFDHATPCNVVPQYRRGKLPFQQLNVIGREYDTWLMNPKFLLPQLIKDITAAGVTLRRMHFESMEQVGHLDQTIIINCLGLGARDILSDPRLMPISGHLVVLQNPARLTYFFSGGCRRGEVTSYMFCRQDDIVIGGSTNRGDERQNLNAPIDQQIRAEIFANIRRVFDGAPDSCVDLSEP